MPVIPNEKKFLFNKVTEQSNTTKNRLICSKFFFCLEKAHNVKKLNCFVTR